MDKRKEKAGWTPVPQFGGWDHKASGATNYSMVFSQARANRKQHKTDVRHASLGNEQELIGAAARRHQQQEQQHQYQHQHQHHDEAQDDPVMKRKRILTYINCCIRPY